MAESADREFLEAVKSVAQGKPVDWEQSSGSNDRSEALEMLRIVERISRVARSERQEIDQLSASRSTTLGAVRASAPARAPQTGPPAESETWGPLRLIEQIGRGTSGEVYRAWDPALEIEVALKLWHSRWTTAAEEAHFLAEARRLAQVRHPNVLAVRGAASHAGRVGMWTELLQGPTLEDSIVQHGVFGAAEAAVVGVELCRALAAVHAAGFVHRDLKTRNVARAQGGRIVLMDFGSASLSEPSGDDLFSSGTPLTMAPEQILGGRVGPAADLYGLGVLLYRLVSGHYPVDATSLEELELRHRASESTPLRDRRPDLPTAFIQIVERCLSPDPAARPSSAGSLEQELVAFLGAAGGAEPKAPATASPDPRPDAASAASGLPPPALTRFIGRHHEVSAVLELLRQHRLVSLLGTGGCGKTRLALRVAEEWQRATNDPAQFVDLSPLNEGERVAAVTAMALGLRAGSAASASRELRQYLSGRRQLIVFDNCEQVLEGVRSILTELLPGCPQTTFLITSRESVGAPGEVPYPVPPLSYPESGAPLDIERLAAYESVQLLVTRASQASSGFKLGPDNAAAVAEICHRVDGIPLAIELLAARIGVLTPEEICERLDRVLRLATTTRSAVPPRQRAIAASIQLSYDRLDERERTGFERLSVFRSGWTLESATAVCARGADELDTLDLLTRLVDKSLVVHERPLDGPTRFRFLEVVRQFARDRLEKDAAAEETRGAFIDYFLDLSETALGKLWGPEQAAWLRRLDVEHDNFLEALAQPLPPEQVGKALRLAGSLFRYWYTRGHFEVARRAFHQVLGKPGSQTPSSDRCRALFGAAGMAVFNGDLPGARAMYEEGLEYDRRVGNRPGSARWMIGIGLVSAHEGDFPAAERLHIEALALYREDAVNRSAIPIVMHNLSHISRCSADFTRARDWADQGLAVARETNNRMACAMVLANLAFLDAEGGDPERARNRLRECFQLVQELGLRQSGLEALESAARLALARDDARRAARLIGVAVALREAWDVPAGILEKPMIDSLRSTARERLGAAAFEEARAAGRALTYEKAVEETLLWLE